MEELIIRSTRARQNLMEWSRRVADCRGSGMAEMSDTSPRFAELLPPADEKQSTAPEKKTDLVASVRIGDASLEVYSGASSEIVSALCKVLYNGPINLDHGIEKMREHGIMRLNEGRSKHHVIQNIHIGIQSKGSHRGSPGR